MENPDGELIKPCKDSSKFSNAENRNKLTQDEAFVTEALHGFLAQLDGTGESEEASAGAAFNVEILRRLACVPELELSLGEVRAADIRAYLQVLAPALLV